MLFDRQVAESPGAIALIYGEQQVTYRQLADRTNRLARHLQAVGVGKESLVAVFINRSPEMIVGMLAILKVGAAYVPLDPAYPSDRIGLVIEDSQAAVVLTSEARRATLPPTLARVVSLDAAAVEIAKLPASDFESPAEPSNLAYVIYTSGSTGRPKGVMVEHRNVVSFFSAMDAILGVEPGVWLAETSISFDISVLELLWTLTRGFTVVLHGDEGVHTIPTEIARHGVTHFQATPSLARMLAAQPAALAALGSLKTLLLGGEALPASLAAVLRDVVKGETYNIYGPTETTVWSTAYKIPAGGVVGSSVPIGRPLANTRVYVLAPDFQPVAAGDAGELFIGGEGVVRGYWKRADLTAERFLPDPFVGGGRMYRTGDIARFLPGGDLEFLGRSDFQVKLRGFRIELGEIEFGLERCDGVRQAVVVAREFAAESQAEDKRLVAYVVADEGRSPPHEALRAALRSHLPDYMVPAHFVFLDRLPMTANGKIDRNALPGPVDKLRGTDSAASSGEGPRSEIERTLTRAWGQALGVQHVNLDANIFDLGATSLMVPEVLIEVERQLNREIPLVDFFEHHTVRALAAHLAGDSATVMDSDRARRRRNARSHE